MPASKKRRYRDISSAAQKQLNPNKEITKRHKSDAEGVLRRSTRKYKPTKRFQSFMEEFQARIAACSERSTSTGFVRRAKGELEVFMKEWPASFSFFDPRANSTQATEYDLTSQSTDPRGHKNNIIANSEEGFSSDSEQDEPESQSDISMMATSEEEFSEQDEPESQSDISMMATSEEEFGSDSEQSEFDSELSSGAASSGQAKSSAPRQKAIIRLTPVKNKSGRMPSGIDGLQNRFGQSGTPVRSSVLPSRRDGQKVFSYISGAIGEECLEFSLYQKNNYREVKGISPANIFETEASANLRKITQNKRPHQWTDRRKKNVLESQAVETKQAIELSGVFNQTSRSQAKRTDTRSKGISVNNHMIARHMKLSGMDFQEYKHYQRNKVEAARRVRHAWYHLVPACLGGHLAVSQPAGVTNHDLLVAATEGANHAKLVLELAVLNYIKQNPAAEISFLVQVVDGIETTTLSHQDKKLVVSHALMDPNYPTSDYVKLIYRLFQAIFVATQDKKEKLAEILGSVQVRMMPHVSQERRAPVPSCPRSKFFDSGARNLKRALSFSMSL